MSIVGGADVAFRRVSSADDAAGGKDSELIKSCQHSECVARILRDWLVRAVLVPGRRVLGEELYALVTAREQILPLDASTGIEGVFSFDDGMMAPPSTLPLTSRRLQLT